MPHFWTGGPKAYRQALDQECRQRKKTLKEQLIAAPTLASQEKYSAELKSLKDECTAKKRAIKESQF